MNVSNDLNPWFGGFWLYLYSLELLSALPYLTKRLCKFLVDLVSLRTYRAAKFQKILPVDVITYVLCVVLQL